VATGASPARSTGLLAHETEIPTGRRQVEMIDPANGLDTWDRTDFLKYLLVERPGMPSGSLFCAQNSNHHRKHIVRIKSRINVLQRHKSANHQSGAGQQDDSKSKFRTDQQSAQPVAMLSIA